MVSVNYFPTGLGNGLGKGFSPGKSQLPDWDYPKASDQFRERVRQQSGVRSQLKSLCFGDLSCPLGEGQSVLS